MLSLVISCVTQYNLIFLMVSVQVFSILFRIGLSLAYDQGCVRLTLFRDRNTYNDVKEIPHKRFLEVLEYKITLVSTRVCRNVFTKLLIEINLTVLLLILIPE